MMKNIYVVLIGLFLAGGVSAQQLPQYSQFTRNQFMVNPAACGVYDFVDITLGGRYQWVGFDDAPQTGYLYVSALLKKRKRNQFSPSIRTSQGIVSSPKVSTGRFKHAIGGQLISDQYGAFGKLSVAGTYALHLPLSKKLNLSFGTKVGISNDRFDKDKAQVLSQMPDASNFMIDNEYNQFVASQGRVNYLNISAGLYLYSKNLFLGASIDQLSQDFVKFGPGSSNVQPELYYQFTGGYNIPISSKVKLTPSVLYKFINTYNYSLEGALTAEFNDRLWVGASYRNSKALIGMAGITISNKFKFGYSYDFDLSNVRNYSNGGHEIILGIMLGRD
jgi:type IX secretion system PorP/SprF family membrane protein